MHYSNTPPLLPATIDAADAEVGLLYKSGPDYIMRTKSCHTHQENVNKQALPRGEEWIHFVRVARLISLQGDNNRLYLCNEPVFDGMIKRSHEQIILVGEPSFTFPK